MQKSYIMVDVDTKRQVSADGNFVTKVAEFPTIERGQWQVLCIQFVRRRIDDVGGVEVELSPLDLAASYLFVADNDFNDDNSLMLKSYMSTIAFSESNPESNRFNIQGDWIDGSTADMRLGQMSIRINSDTSKFAEVLGNKKTVQSNLYINIKQYITGFSNPSSIAWLQFVAQNTVRDWGTPEEMPPEGSVIVPFISAYLKSGFEFQFSVDGVSDWHETQTAEDKYYRQRIANVGAEWSEAVIMAPGQKGEPGNDGEDGADGYTPQKGVDYWTDADKAEIKNYVDEQILNGEW